MNKRFPNSIRSLWGWVYKLFAGCSSRRLFFCSLFQVSISWKLRVIHVHCVISDRGFISVSIWIISMIFYTLSFFKLYFLFSVPTAFLGSIIIKRNLRCGLFQRSLFVEMFSSPSSSSSASASSSCASSPEKEKFKPQSLLGRLIKTGQITKLEEVFERGIAINETDSIDYLARKTLETRVLKIIPSTQFIRTFYQRIRDRVVVVVGDGTGHLGLGSSFGGTEAAAKAGAEKNAKLNLISVKLCIFSTNDLTVGSPHTIEKVTTGMYGNFEAILQPAPRETGIKGSGVAKYLLELWYIRLLYCTNVGVTSTCRLFVCRL